eukprot:TRINITY_DN1268_c0_g1_i1.p1 TRINITY_DN1268_c0_g1~~TRINITY_DN1268_c0_g1_i1.p1  ORF type:complete len:219 (-),score=56.40 TRINITY_DN1268_c0_g1_i1:172-828(-)
MSSTSNISSFDYKHDGEERLKRLFSEWNSQYCYLIHCRNQTKRTLIYDTLWSKKSTSQKPLSDLRVAVEFTLKYPKRSSPDVEMCYRIEHETLIHTELTPIDQHLSRLFAFKEEFFQRNSLDLENKSFFDTRLTTSSFSTQLEKKNKVANSTSTNSQSLSTGNMSSSLSSLSSSSLSSSISNTNTTATASSSSSLFSAKSSNSIFAAPTRTHTTAFRT